MPTAGRLVSAFQRQGSELPLTQQFIDVLAFNQVDIARP
jgi:hypothetical protein